MLVYAADLTGTRATRRLVLMGENLADCGDTCVAIARAINKLIRRTSSSSCAPPEAYRAIEELSSKGLKKDKLVQVALLDAWREENCPPDKDGLGRGTWSLLHNIAAKYPDNPTQDQKVKITNLFESLATFFPCKICARDFTTNIKCQPPRVESREELSVWLCEQHNIVNAKLGKPLFHCDLDLLDNRWRRTERPECHDDNLSKPDTGYGSDQPWCREQAS